MRHELHLSPTAPVRALVLALASVALLAGCGTSGSSPPAASSPGSTGTEAKLEGAALPGEVPAPGFTLTDQRGRRVSLSDYRGRVVVLTFLYSTCGAPCVLIAQQIRGALDELDEEHVRGPVALIVSADPAADTPAHVASFLAEVSLTGRVEYLTGSLSQLRPIWSAYHVRPASAGRTTFQEYASVLLVDRRGAQRVLFQSEQLTPEGISHDVRVLEATAG
jgi:protein SCO1/2